VVIFIIGGIVKSGESCYFIHKDDINACTFKGRVLEFQLFQNDKYIWSGDYVSDLNKVSGNLCIEFETQVAVEDNEIINYISKSNVNQAIEVLETFYNNITTSQPRVCSTYLWSYNMLSHFQENHHGVPCDFLITEDEKEAVLNFKTGFKN
jgi:guanylate kinase